VSLKYERLDAYCTDCGLIGHKQVFCQAPQAERFLAKYLLTPPSFDHHFASSPLPSSSQDFVHGLESSQLQISSSTPNASHCKTPLNPSTSLTSQFPKHSSHSAKIAQTPSQTVLLSQDVSNPISPTVATNISSLHIPLNAMSLY
jgi:hypothetical protein